MSTRCKKISVDLCHGDVDEGLGCWVYDIEELHDGGAVVGDGGVSPIEHKLVHAAGSKSGSHGVSDSLACVDIADDLRLSLRGISALLEKDDLRLEGGVHGYSRPRMEWSGPVYTAKPGLQSLWVVGCRVSATWGNLKRSRSQGVGSG